MKKRYWLLLGAVLLWIGVFLVARWVWMQRVIDETLLAAELNRSMATEILVVNKYGGHFSISNAVVDAQDGAFIVVFPGTYQEAVDASFKTVTIIGTDKSNCVLTNGNGDYMLPPLEMGSGALINMTIHATGEEKNPQAIAKAYAMHVDYDSSKGQTLRVENVDFINDDYQTVGIGLREHFSLIFSNCRFYCRSNSNAFYCHDDPTKMGSIDQRLMVENCYFENTGTAATIRMQSQEQDGSQILCVWKNNTVVNKQDGPTLESVFWNPKVSDGGGWLGMSYWENSTESAGNTLAMLDFNKSAT